MGCLFQDLGESKIASMVESKDFRKGIIQLEWCVLAVCFVKLNVVFNTAYWSSVSQLTVKVRLK